MSRSLRYGALAAVLVLSTVVPAPTSATAAPFALSFRVVTEDGSAVARPITMVSVFGRTYTSPRVSTGNRLGEVSVPLPADDPVVIERLAAGEPVNLMIRVFDKKPGSSGINAAYIGAAVARDAHGALTDVSGISGMTFTLRPGRTAFVKVAEADVARILNQADSIEDDPDCPHFGPGTPVPCHLVDYPEWSRNTRIPIAENHGAGADVTATLRYRSTHVTKSNFAIEVGAGGFMDADGSVGFERENTVTLGFSPRGGGVNRRAYLVTEMVRTRSGACFQQFPSSEWDCQLETTYRPGTAHGTVSEDWPIGHDNLNRVRDCWTDLDGHMGHAKGETRQLHYSLTLGPTENWAAGSEKVLYANTTVTSQTNSTKGHVRAWNVTDFNYQYHYVYVPDGMLDYDSTQTGGGAARCTENAAPEIRTHASDVNLHDIEEAIGVSGTTRPPPDEGYPGRTVCGRMPDKCD
ncbi:MAG TPA: hypothetical protein VNQ77_08415 [Frankiaceae bacterium]|nr:hypothetical protein [Frankiaceae bacterium]